jgi:hypothetical protein
MALRHKAIFLARGWFGHADVPSNSHFDPGNLKWSVILDLAKTMLRKKVVV